jgi:hypothetical protein
LQVFCEGFEGRGSCSGNELGLYGVLVFESRVHSAFRAPSSSIEIFPQGAWIQQHGWCMMICVDIIFPRGRGGSQVLVLHVDKNRKGHNNTSLFSNRLPFKSI